MNKLTKNFLLLTILFTSAGLKPAAAAGSDDEECLFTPNAAFCIEGAGSHRQAWADVNADLAEAAEVATEIVTTQQAQQATLARLSTALATLQSDVQRRTTEIDGSPQDIFKGQIYRSLNLTANNICSYLTPQVLSILVSRERAAAVLALIEQFHTGSVGLESDFAKSHRSEHTKNKIRNSLVDLQRLEYAITGIGNDAVSAHRREGGAFSRVQ